MTKSSEEVVQIEGLVWTLPEVMRHSLLAPVWQTLLGKMPQQGEWVIKIEKVVDLDSSLIAFLLACLRQATERKVSLCVQGRNSKIMNLLSVYGVKSLFEPSLSEPIQ